jgi:outer membrane receptor protein involved in Fe transport
MKLKSNLNYCRYYKLQKSPNMKITFAFLLLMLIVDNSHTQPAEGSISGTVTDKKSSQPIENADVKLLRTSDSSLIKGTTTDNLGYFKIENVPYGKYILRISYIGFSNVTISGILINPTNKNYITDTIKLSQGETVTEEITVESEKSLVELKGDKKVFNISQSPLSQSGTLLDLLKELPSITVDQDGNVSLRGSEAVKILIDGKPLGLDGSGRNNVFRQIPSSAVESIEFITNPSAKFEAEGSSGIINILLKKNSLSSFGYNGNVVLNIGTGDKYVGSTSLSVKSGKIKFNINYSYNIFNSIPSGFNDRTSYLYNTQTDITNSGTSRLKSHLLRGGIEYNPDPRNTISLNITYQNGGNNSVDKSVYKIFDTGNNLISDYLYTSDNESENTPLDINAVYKRTFKDIKQTLSTELNYSYNKDKNNYLNRYNYILPSVSQPPLTKITQDEKSNDVSFQADYTQPVGVSSKIETGIRTSYKKRDIDYISEFYDYNQNNFINDSNQTNSFSYREYINAVYGVFSIELDPFGISLGIRGEHTKSDGRLVNNNTTFDNRYLDIFPSASVSYKISRSTQIQLSYSRRINRPRPGQLNPFRSVRGANNFFTGNPALKPEFTNSFELSFIQFLPFLTVTPTLFYKHTTDEISRKRTLEDSTTTVVSFENYGTTKSYGGELILNSNLFGILNFNGSFSISRREVDATNISSSFSNQGTVWSTRLMGMINLPLEFGLQISYFYSGKRITAQGFIEPFQSFDAALKKDLFNKRLTITARISDILDKSKFRGEFNDPSFSEIFERRRDSRTFFVNLTYSFGQKEKETPRIRRDENRRRDDDIDF